MAHSTNHGRLLNIQSAKNINSQQNLVLTVTFYTGSATNNDHNGSRGGAVVVMVACWSVVHVVEFSGARNFLKLTSTPMLAQPKLINKNNPSIFYEEHIFSTIADC